MPTAMACRPGFWLGSPKEPKRGSGTQIPVPTNYRTERVLDFSQFDSSLRAQSIFASFLRKGRMLDAQVSK